VPEPLDPERLFRALDEQAVDYVLIGDLAAVLHGSPLVTNDADICPRREPDNLRRLAAALRGLDARLRTATEPAGVAFACDAESFEHMQMVNMATSAGAFDVSFEPAAFPGYDTLKQRAVPMVVYGVTVHVASLRDIIESKQVASRLQDQATLPHLYALADEIDRTIEP